MLIHRRFIQLQFLFLLLSIPAFAQTKGLGVGLMFGEPVGLTCKRWIAENTSIDITIGASVATVDERITVLVDYLWHKPGMLKENEIFPFFYGLGLSSSTRKDESTQHGIRGVAGISWIPKKFPCDFFIEAAPVVVLHPFLGIRFEMGAGLRYFFKTID